MSRKMIEPLMAVLLVSLSSAGLADTTTTVNISGTLVDAPVCTVNSNNQVNVNFGTDIITYQVNGTNYKQQIAYTLTCTTLSQQGLTMTLNGTAASFNSGLIKTSNSGLGIQLLNGTTAIAPGSAIKFNYTTQPVLYAVPVAQDARTLATGPFTGTATMVITYQ
jgi:hypothetical protein